MPRSAEPFQADRPSPTDSSHLFPTIQVRLSLSTDLSHSRHAGTLPSIRQPVSCHCMPPPKPTRRSNLCPAIPDRQADSIRSFPHSTRQPNPFPTASGHSGPPDKPSRSRTLRQANSISSEPHDMPCRAYPDHNRPVRVRTPHDKLTLVISSQIDNPIRTITVLPNLTSRIMPPRRKRQSTPCPTGPTYHLLANPGRIDKPSRDETSRPVRQPNSILTEPSDYPVPADPTRID